MSKERRWQKPDLFMDLFGPIPQFLDGCNRLTIQEREILEFRYVEGKKLKEIAERKSVSVEAIRHAEARGLGKLRCRIKIFVLFCPHLPNQDGDKPEEHTQIDIRDVPLEDLEMSVRLYNVLVSNTGHKTVGDLLDKSQSYFLKQKNFGRKCLKELLQLLETNFHLTIPAYDQSK